MLLLGYKPESLATVSTSNLALHSSQLEPVVSDYVDLQGSICVCSHCSYGLLGSSGCGKTTLLRCILGQFNLAMGHITVLGRRPGASGHQVPGRDVGYMPQVGDVSEEVEMH